MRLICTPHPANNVLYEFESMLWLGDIEVCRGFFFRANARDLNDIFTCCAIALFFFTSKLMFIVMGGVIYWVLYYTVCYYSSSLCFTLLPICVILAFITLNYGTFPVLCVSHTSTAPIVGVGKREAHINWSMKFPE